MLRLAQRLALQGFEAGVAHVLALDQQLISDRNESLKLGSMKKELGSGFEMGGKYRGTGGDIRMSIDKALDAPAPKYDLADPE